MVPSVPETEAALRYVKGMELAQKLLAAQLMYYAAGDNNEKRGLIDRVKKVLKSDVYQGKESQVKCQKNLTSQRASIANS